MTKLRLFLLVFGGIAAISPQTRVTGPLLGYIFDGPGLALRPILGMPGAADFGNPLPSASGVTFASISLRQNIAVVNNGSWQAIQLSHAGAGTTTNLPQGLPSTAQVALSEDGTSVLFYDAPNNALTVVTGINSSPTGRIVPLDALPGVINAMAVADDGSLLLSSAIPAGGEALFWVGPDSSSIQLTTLQSTASISLSSDGSSAMIVDRGANRIYQIQNPGASASITLLASDADGVSNPVGAAIGNNQLWIANAGASSVLGINTNSRVTVSLPCGFNLTRLIPLAGGKAFRLNDLDGINTAPVWILDTSDGAAPQITFIPAIRRPADQQETAQ